MKLSEAQNHQLRITNAVNMLNAAIYDAAGDGLITNVELSDRFILGVGNAPVVIVCVAVNPSLIKLD